MRRKYASIILFAAGCALLLAEGVYARNTVADAADGSVISDADALVNAARQAKAAGGWITLHRSYHLASSVEIEANIRFEGAILEAAPGTRVVIRGAIDAPLERQIFYGKGDIVAKTAPLVSVAWWGALDAASNDAAPAFRAAWGSNRRIVAPAGTYRLCSTESIPSDDARAVDPEAILYAGGDNVDVNFTGATLQVCENIAKSAVGTLAYDRVRHLHHRGGTFIGTKSGVPANAENNALGFINVVDFNVSDVVCGEGYEGIGSCLGGDWLVDGTFTHIKAVNVGIFADFAFLRHVRFDDVHVTGLGEMKNKQGRFVEGRRNPGQKGFSLIYDPPNASFNKTGISYENSEDVEVARSSFANFVTGIALANGRHIRLVEDDASNNPGISGYPGLGIFIYGTDHAHYPGDISIVGGTLSENGASTTGRALSISCPPRVDPGSRQDTIDAISVKGVKMAGNRDTALDAQASCPFIGRIATRNNRFLLDAIQVHAMSAGFLAHMVPDQ